MATDPAIQQFADYRTIERTGASGGSGRAQIAINDREIRLVSGRSCE